MNHGQSWRFFTNNGGTMENWEVMAKTHSYVWKKLFGLPMASIGRLFFGQPLTSGGLDMRKTMDRCWDKWVRRGFRLILLDFVMIWCDMHGIYPLVITGNGKIWRSRANSSIVTWDSSPSLMTKWWDLMAIPAIWKLPFDGGIRRAIGEKDMMIWQSETQMISDFQIFPSKGPSATSVLKFLVLLFGSWPWTQHSFQDMQSLHLI